MKEFPTQTSIPSKEQIPGAETLFNLVIKTTEKPIEVTNYDLKDGVLTNRIESRIQKDVYLDSLRLQEGLENGTLVDEIEAIPGFRLGEGSLESAEKVKAMLPNYPYIPFSDHTEFYLRSEDREQLARAVTDFYKQHATFTELTTYIFDEKPIHYSRVADPEELYALLLEESMREQSGNWEMRAQLAVPGLPGLETTLNISTGRRPIPLPKSEDGKYEFEADMGAGLSNLGTDEEYAERYKKWIQLDVLSLLRIGNTLKKQGLEIDIPFSRKGEPNVREGDKDTIYHAT